MNSITTLDKEAYEHGFSKLSQLEALLLLASTGCKAALTGLSGPSQKNLAELAYDLALEARCCLSETAGNDK